MKCNLILKIIILFLVDLLNAEQKEKITKKLDVLAMRNGFLGWWMTSAKDNHNIERPLKVLVDKILSLNNRCPLILYV